MQTILIATTNRGKLREVRAILDHLPVHFTTLANYPNLPEPIEDAVTFEGNAKLKALHYARLTGCWTLADDSGLEVDALGGEPGTHSARYAGPECDVAANNAKVIKKLTGIPPEQRTARFRCAIALASPEEVVATATGAVEGMIVDDARGTNGFGYDPHFFVPEYGMTTAEMPPEQKNRISHRGEALRAIHPAIERMLSDSDAFAPGRG
ncbi:MAG: XTP/dITP diphosphatase [Phycisphaerae bacterium]